MKVRVRKPKRRRKSAFMNLLELVQYLASSGVIRMSRYRDILSSARQYARLLGYDDPVKCPESVFACSEWERARLIEDRLPESSAHKIRNLKNNISFLLKNAVKDDLIYPIYPGVDDEEPRAKRGGRSHRKGVDIESHQERRRASYNLRFADWPEVLRAGYEEWLTKAGGDETDYSDLRRRRLSPQSIRSKRAHFERFFGFLKKEQKREELSFEMLVDVDLVEKFVRWHVEERVGRVTRLAVNFVEVVRALARNYFHERQAEEEFERLHASLGQPEKLLSKEDRLVKLTDLLRATAKLYPSGDSIMFDERKARRAANEAGRCLAVMLMATRPILSKFYREARLDENLSKRRKGVWVLHFKKSVTGGREKEYSKEVPSQIVPYLKKYIEYWRPMISSDPERGFLFLRQSGRHYNTPEGYSQWIQRGTLPWIGKIVGPDLIRRSFATEFISETQDLDEAARLMFEQPETLRRTFGQLLRLQEEGQKVDKWFVDKLRPLQQNRP